MDFFFRLIVTFSKRIESRGRTEGERGVLSENIFKYFCKEGSTKEGEAAGLREGEPEDWGLDWPEVDNGGKSASENKGATIDGIEEGTTFDRASIETKHLPHTWF